MIKARLTTLFRAVMGLVAALLGSYYSAKYALLARRLGLPHVSSDGRPGFIVIQIDGLAYDHLLQALELGYAPTLQRMLEQGEMRLHPWKPGIPSTTPAVQAGILFGNNDEIPSYRWYDKEAGESRVAVSPGTAQAIQQRLTEQGQGILQGGSSYMNMFDGDASLAMFTVGSIGRHRFFEGIRGVGFLVLFVLNPLRSLLVIVLSIWEYLVDLVQRGLAFVRQETPRPLGRMFPFLRVISNVVLREIQTFSALLDIYRGVPGLYTTYLGYDELAHHYGPLSKPALRALRAIDKRIQRIDRFRRLVPTRPYHLYILSDHGMTEGTPFAAEFGQTIGEVVQELVGRSVRLNETYGARRQDLIRTLYLQDELQAIEEGIGAPLSRIPFWLRRYMARRLPYEIGDWDESAEHTDLVVRNSGSLSHVYFNVRKEQLEIREILSIYPSLVSSLLAHPGIWLVVGRDEDNVVIFGRDGLVSLNGGYHVEGEDPLSQIPYAHWAARQLARLARFRSSGDLILIGGYHPETGRISVFEDQWAAHGALGGPQDMAVLMVEPNVPWCLTAPQQSTDIHFMFTQLYHAS